VAYRRDSRVRATTSAPGTGTATLVNVTGYASFSTLTDGDVCHYVIADQSGGNYEFGLGTKGTSGGPTLQRSAGNVLGGSAGAGTLVNFASGTQDVFLTPLGEADVLPPAAADPSVATAGQQYYHTARNEPRFYDGTGWQSLLGPTPNYLINGGGDFFQRQNPLVATSRSDDTYAGDRWYVLTQTAAIQANRSTGDTASRYAHKLTQNQAAAQRMGYAQIVEGVNARALRGKVARFQARIKCSSSQAIRIAILGWTVAADLVISDVVNDWTSGTYTVGNFFIATNLTVSGVSSVTPSAATWTDISVTGTISSSANNVIVFIWTEGTAAQNVTLEITEAGLYEGATARAWMPRPVLQEILLCQRYYEKATAIDTAPGSNFGTSNQYDYAVGPLLSNTWSSGAGRSHATVRLVPKRTTPTCRFWDLIGNLSKMTYFDLNGQNASHNILETSAGLAGVTADRIGIQSDWISTESKPKWSAQWDADAEL
jgi:hypothetical protein